MDVKSHRFLEKSKARLVASHCARRQWLPRPLVRFFFSGDCLGGFVFINPGQPQNSIINPNSVPCLKSLQRILVMFPIELNNLK